jgi:hypothetical protein
MIFAALLIHGITPGPFLLKEHPKIVGLTVPGMVTGSPGMEGGTPEHYQVLAFDARGNTTVFSKY